MFTIFSDLFSLIFDYIKRFAGKLYYAKRVYKLCAFSVISLAAVSLCMFFSGMRIGYNVNYGGETIAVVKNKAQFSAALDIVKSKVSGKNVETVISQPEYSATLTLNSGIKDEKSVANAIIEKTDGIVYASTLYVDGKKVACAETEALKNCLEDYKNSFAVEAKKCYTVFNENVKLKNGYFLKSDVDGIDDVKEEISKLTVKTVATVVTDIKLPYGTQTVKTADKVIGYTNVETKGKFGLSRRTEETVYLNGELVSSRELSYETVSEPVDEVLVVGTAKSEAKASERSKGHNSGFLFPLPNGVWQVSAYYGDGRGHKGVDLRAPKGTPISAVSDGTVIYASYYGGYGYCIKVDHGNGITTLYAHASQLCVSVGEKVSAGETLALVGSTGNASGNHLHFEVMVGGKNVDPSPYINID